MASASHRSSRPCSPSFRFLIVLAVLAGAVYGGLYALATLVDPQPREMVITVSPDKFQRPE